MHGDKQVEIGVRIHQVSPAGSLPVDRQIMSYPKQPIPRVFGLEIFRAVGEETNKSVLNNILYFFRRQVPAAQRSGQGGTKFKVKGGNLIPGKGCGPRILNRGRRGREIAVRNFDRRSHARIRNSG